MVGRTFAKGFQRAAQIPNSLKTSFRRERMATVNVDDRETIRAASEAELLNLTLAGLSAALIPGVLGCVLLGLGLSRLHRFRTSPT